MLDSRTDVNVRTEKLAREYLINLKQGFHECSKEAREQILKAVINDPVYKKSFDLIKLNVQRTSPINSLSPDDLKELQLVEVKSSNRNIPVTLKGYYFSVQQREIDLAERLGDRVIFAFVIIPRNESKPFYSILSWSEILQKATKKRVQVNINF